MTTHRRSIELDVEVTGNVVPGEPGNRHEPPGPWGVYNLKVCLYMGGAWRDVTAWLSFGEISKYEERLIEQAWNERGER